MALIQSMEATGAKLFKYRGQIPVLIFVLALPLMWFTNSNLYVWETWGSPLMVVCTVCAAVLTLAGLALRAYTVCTTPKGTSGRNTARQVADHISTPKASTPWCATRSTSPTTSSGPDCSSSR